MNSEYLWSCVWLLYPKWLVEGTFLLRTILFPISPFHLSWSCGYRRAEPGCSMHARQMPHPQSRLVTAKPWEELAHPDDTLLFNPLSGRWPWLPPSLLIKVGLDKHALFYHDKKAKFHSSLPWPCDFSHNITWLRVKDWFLFLFHVENILGTCSVTFSKQRPCHYR